MPHKLCYISRYNLHLYILDLECRHLQALFSDPHPFHYYFSSLADFPNENESPIPDGLDPIDKLAILYFVHILRRLADRFSSQSQTMLNSQTHVHPGFQDLDRVSGAQPKTGL